MNYQNKIKKIILFSSMLIWLPNCFDSKKLINFATDKIINNMKKNNKFMKSLKSDMMADLKNKYPNKFNEAYADIYMHKLNSANLKMSQLKQLLITKNVTLVTIDNVMNLVDPQNAVEDILGDTLDNLNTASRLEYFEFYTSNYDDGFSPPNLKSKLENMNTDFESLESLLKEPGHSDKEFEDLLNGQSISDGILALDESIRSLQL